MKKESSPIRFRTLATLGTLLLALHLAFLLFLEPGWHQALVSDLAETTEGLLASLALFWASRASCSQSTRAAAAWGILALGQMLWAAGSVVWTVIEVALEQDPFPSLADALYLSYYPLFMLGIMLMPAVPLSRREWKRLGLDLGMMMMSAALVFWCYWLGPVLATTPPDTATLAFSAAYPLFDLVLLFALLVMIFRGISGPSQAPALMLASSVAMFIVADVVFGYRSTIGVYQSGELTDILWAGSLILGGLAGCLQVVLLRDPTAVTGSAVRVAQGTWKQAAPYLPYVWLIISYATLVGRHDEGYLPFPLLAGGVGVIICLVSIRQILALRDNVRLFERLTNAHGGLEFRVEERTRELALANADLQQEVGERKRAEAAAVRANEEWEKTFDSVPDLIFTLDTDYRVVRANRATAELLRCTASDLQGRKCFSLIHGTEAPPPWCVHTILLHNGTEQFCERYEERLRGYFSVSVNPLHNEQGKLIGSVHVMRDMTERRKAEEEASLHRTRLQCLLELHRLMDAPQNQILASALESSRRTTESSYAFIGLLNDAATVMTLHSYATDVMRECQVAESPIHFPIAEAGLWADAVRNRVAVVVNDYRSHTPKKGYPPGHVHINRFLSVPVKHGDRVVAVAAVANKKEPYDDSDVASLTVLVERAWSLLRRKEAEDALRESENKLRGIIEQASDSIGLCDEEGRVVEWNTAAERLTGRKRSEVIGRPTWEVQYELAPLALRTPLLLSELKESITGALRTGQAPWLNRVSEGEIETPGGLRRHVQQALFSIRTAKGFMLGNISRDITERRITEAKLVYLSSHDPLTGLHNRAFFEDQILRAPSPEEIPLSVVISDVNGMKATNDSLGHAAGDELLRRAGRLLRDAFRPDDIVARIGGDEFAVLLKRTGETAIQEIVRRIRDQVALQGGNDSCPPLSLAIGAATCCEGGDLSQTLKTADRRMYEDKETTRKFRTAGRPGRKAGTRRSG